MRVFFFACGFGHIVFYPSILDIGWWLYALCLVLLPVLSLLLVLVLLLIFVRCKRSQPGAAISKSLFGKAHRPTLRITVLALFFVLGSAAGSWQLASLVSNILPAALDKTPAQLQFDVQSIKREGHKSRLLVGVIKAEAWPALEGRNIPLSWYKPPALEIGQQWAASVTLRRPRGMANPRGFDYAAWLLAQGFIATGYRNGQKEATLESVRPLTLPEQLRGYIEQDIARVLGSHKSGAFFKALLIGDRSDLVSSDWQTLQATGTIHLMAISGLHVGLVASVGFLLGAFLVRCLGWLNLTHNPWGKRLLPAAIAIILAAAYAYLAGFSIPTQRALWAVIIVNLAVAYGVRLSALRWLAIIFALVTLTEPLAWLQQGFWLSFFAVAVLIISYRGLAGPAQKSLMLLDMQLRLFFTMLIPLSLLALPVSYMSPIANIIAVPMVAFVLVPGLLIWLPASLTPVGDWVLWILAKAFDALWFALEAFATTDAALVYLNVLHSPGLIALLGLAALGWLAPRALAFRAWSLLLFGVLVFGVAPLDKPPRLTVLDVGQGLAVVIQHNTQATVYDTGAHFSDRFNIGEQVVVPFMRSSGIRQAELIVSHGDNDHAGGAGPVMAAFAGTVRYGQTFKALANKPANKKAVSSKPVSSKPASVKKVSSKKVGNKDISSKEVNSKALGSNSPETSGGQCAAGQYWVQGSAQYEVLWPPSKPYELPTAALKKNNNQSCVVLLTIKGTTILMPGDIEAVVERKLLQQGLIPDVDILIAPHHGSKTSSSRRFLAAAKPEHIVVSAGYKNRYNHPHPKILKRYAEIGASVWRTDLHGAITFEFSHNRDFAVATRRTQHVRPWHEPIEYVPN